MFPPTDVLAGKNRLVDLIESFFIFSFMAGGISGAFVLRRFWWRAPVLGHKHQTRPRTKSLLPHPLH